MINGLRNRFENNGGGGGVMYPDRMVETGTTKVLSTCFIKLLSHLTLQ